MCQKKEITNSKMKKSKNFKVKGAKLFQRAIQLNKIHKSRE